MSYGCGRVGFVGGDADFGAVGEAVGDIAEDAGGICRIVQDYAGVDSEMVWRVIAESLPQLAVEIAKIQTD